MTDFFESPDAPPRGDATANARVDELTAELSRAQQRVDALARAYQELETDREDFRRRLTRERDRMLEVAKGESFLIVIDLIDELDRALELEPGGTSPVAQGVRMIRDGAIKRLAESGVSRLQLVGAPFDPNLAEAVDAELVGPEQDGLVLGEHRAGYATGERVIRAARVVVGRYMAPASA